MEFDTYYYWKIVAHDNHGASTTGPVWSFKTYIPNAPPNSPSNPYPPDGSTNVNAYTTLSWTYSDPNGDNLYYDVYLEANDSTPDILVFYHLSAPYYDPGGLNYSTHYYWQIIAFDEYGASTAGPIWSFTTGSVPDNPPNSPSNPSPSNGTINCSININLIWTGGDPDHGDTVFYDVYFEANDTTPDTLVSEHQVETTFNPGTLYYGKTYYWQIIAFDQYGAAKVGPIWHFTTINQNNPPNKPTITGPTKFNSNQLKKFTFMTTDPDGNQIYYYVDWGDGSNSGWQGPYASGYQINISHNWTEKAAFTIKCKAKDIYGTESSWATFDIIIPRNKIVPNTLLQRFFQNHLNMFLILKKLLNRLEQ